MDAKASLLLHRVWGMPNVSNDRMWATRSIPYIQHYRAIIACSLVDKFQAEELAQLVELVRRHKCTALQVTEITSLVQAQQFQWLPHPVDEDTIVHALELAVKLWLFIKVDLRSLHDTLTQVVSKRFTDAIDVHSKDDLSRLSDDFNAKNLERRGGFIIHWTSELTDHLKCVDHKVIMVFRHGSVLQSYLDRDDHLESSIYPAGLLSEIDSTFYLLFPYEGAKAAKHARNVSKKKQIDLIEAGWADDAIGQFERLQLETYPRFRGRLAEIQRRYDAAKPVHPKQWWYDRRRRLEWAALMIGISVFLLTLITVVTSIMQVYAAFRQV